LGSGAIGDHWDNRGRRLVEPYAAVKPPLMHLSIGPDAVAGQFTTVAISPAGTRLVFPAKSLDGKQMLATDTFIEALGPSQEQAKQDQRLGQDYCPDSAETGQNLNHISRFYWIQGKGRTCKHYLISL
jgi:hypothetical protein